MSELISSMLTLRNATELIDRLRDNNVSLEIVQQVDATLALLNDLAQKNQSGQQLYIKISNSMAFLQQEKKAAQFRLEHHLPALAQQQRDFYTQLQLKKYDACLNIATLLKQQGYQELAQHLGKIYNETIESDSSELQFVDPFALLNEVERVKKLLAKNWQNPPIVTLSEAQAQYQVLAASLLNSLPVITAEQPSAEFDSGMIPIWRQAVRELQTAFESTKTNALANLGDHFLLSELAQRARDVNFPKVLKAQLEKERLALNSARDETTRQNHLGQIEYLTETIAEFDDQVMEDLQTRLQVTQNEMITLFGREITSVEEGMAVLADTQPDRTEQIAELQRRVAELGNSTELNNQLELLLKQNRLNELSLETQQLLGQEIKLPENIKAFVKPLISLPN